MPWSGRMLFAQAASKNPMVLVVTPSMMTHRSMNAMPAAELSPGWDTGCSGIIVHVTGDATTRQLRPAAARPSAEARANNSYVAALEAAACIADDTSRSNVASVPPERPSS